MTLSEQIAAKLAEINRPLQVEGRGGVRWGYDPQRRAWFTEGDRLARKAGGRFYQNTTMGMPESVGGTVSADGNVLEPGRGGGVLHGNQVWDPRQGKFITPFSFDKLALYGTLGALTAGTANAVMAGGGAAAYVPGAANIINPASTAAGVGFGAAPAATAAGAGMPYMSLIGTGINAGANIYGANRANAASNRAAAASERGAEAELAFLREQEAERRRQWEVDQAFQAQKWAAEEEERAFNRRIAEATEADRAAERRLRDEREARQGPYREASVAALGRLGTLLTSGQSTWRSPSNAGRGTLGAMVGR